MSEAGEINTLLLNRLMQSFRGIEDFLLIECDCRYLVDHMLCVPEFFSNVKHAAKAWYGHALLGHRYYAIHWNETHIIRVRNPMDLDQFGIRRGA